LPGACAARGECLAPDHGRLRAADKPKGDSMSVIAANPKKEGIIVTIIERTLLLCALVPYAVVALVLRLLLARTFFLAGQDMLDGTKVPFSVYGADLSFLLPINIKDAALALYAAHFPGTTVPTAVTAGIFAWAEFILPILLVIGFATRYAAAFLLVLTVLMQIYLAPGALWSLHVYLMSLLLVLMSCGPGELSIDAIFRYVNGAYVHPSHR
jgi:putative oxidoreductase